MERITTLRRNRSLQCLCGMAALALFSGCATETPLPRGESVISVPKRSGPVVQGSAGIYVQSSDVRPYRGARLHPVSKP